MSFNMKQILATIIMIALATVALILWPREAVYQEELTLPWKGVLPLHDNTDTETMVKQMAASYGVVPEKAVRVAYCESKMGKYDYNLAGSSAKGLFQFIDGTWNDYCEGDVLDPVDNAKCFMKLYNKFPSWWECKG